MDSKQVAFALGLAQKAGKVASGDFAVRSALNGGKAKLMLIACDAAEASRKGIPCRNGRRKNGNRPRPCGNRLGNRQIAADGGCNYG